MAVVLDRSLHLDVETHIMALIYEGKLKPEDRIPEGEIARSLGISRTPVREAIIRLAAAGLVTHVPRRGAYLTRLRHEEAAEVGAARAHLEGYAAALASQRMGPTELNALTGIVRKMADASSRRDWIAGLHLNIMFHEAVVKNSGNRMLHRLWTSVNPFVWLLTPLTTPGQDPHLADIAVRHQALVDVLATRSAERAEQAFKEHIMQVMPAAVIHQMERTGRQESDRTLTREGQT